MNLSKEEKLQIAKKILKTNKNKNQQVIFNLFKDEIKYYLDLQINKKTILKFLEEELNEKFDYITFTKWLKKTFSDTNKTNKQNNHNQTSNTTSQKNQNDNKKAIQTNQNDKQDNTNTTPASDTKPKRRLSKEEMAKFDKLLNDFFKVGAYWEEK